MYKSMLLMLFPIAFASQGASFIDHSHIDISQVININKKQSAANYQKPLAYSDINYVNTGQQVLIRKQQLHYGIPIYGHSIVTNTSTKGFVQTIHGQVVTGIENDIGSLFPMINARQAIDIVKGKFQGVASKPIRNTNANLLIWLDAQQTARLIYKVDYVQMTDKSPSRPISLVDAKSGEIIEQWDGMASLEAEGPGGNQKSGRYYFGANTKYGGFEINNNCQMDSKNVTTLNMSNQEYGGQVHQFDCKVNNYRAVNGAYAPMNDAHYFGQRVFDMYTEWLSTSPIRQKLTMRVHYGTNVGNAFWDGQQMTFGDGDQSMYPLATWDVISHEVSHGFTEQNSNLEYRGMSGGINESFSDVSAAAFSQYIHGSFNWKMGEHVMKYDEAMRYFINPSRDGISIDHINQYYNGIDVHNSSGIFNKAFYHLATSENWDIKKAFMTYATANRLYWSPFSSFQEGADGICKSAQTLGYDSVSVGNAFAQVGINIQDCSSSQPPNPRPDPKPTPDPDTSVLVMDIAVPIQTGGSDELQYLLKNAVTDEVWVQTYFGTGDVDLYVAIDRPASVNDHDCISANTDNNEYCGFGGIQGADIHVMVKGAKSAADVYIKIGGDLSRTEPEPKPEPKPEPEDTCLNLPLWSPEYYYPIGSQVQYYGNRFTALYDNWQEDPYYSNFVWNYEGFCN